MYIAHRNVSFLDESSSLWILSQVYYLPCFTVLMWLWNFDLYQIITPPESLPCRTVLSFCDGRMISL